MFLDLTVVESTSLPALFESMHLSSVVVNKENAEHPSLDFAKFYLLALVRSPDPGSKFATHLTTYQNIPDDQLYLGLLQQGYGAILLHGKDTVLAHAGFQIKADEAHMFSVAIAPEFRNQGLSKMMLLELIEWARRRPDISKIVLGDGGHPAILRIVHALQRVASELSLLPDGPTGFRFIEQ